MQQADFSQVVQEWYDPLFRFALSLVRNRDDALDLTQSAFHKLASNLEKIRDPNRVKSWLFSVLYREFIDQYRRQTRFPTTDLDSIPEPGEERKFSPGFRIDAESMLAVLTSMDEKFRGPLTLFYMESFSYREIAAVLDIPIGTVMSRLRRAKDLLRKLLEEGSGEGRDQKTITFKQQAQ